jgi:hypothetical protein
MSDHSQALFLNLAAKVSTETLKGIRGTLMAELFVLLIGHQHGYRKAIALRNQMLV